MKPVFSVSTVLGCVGTALLAIVVLPSCLDLSDNSPPDVRVAQEVASPGGKTVASFYIISGGGAAGYVIMRLKLRPKSQAFVANEDYVFEMRHEYDLDLKWKDDRHLIVRYPSGADVYRKAATKGHVKITYIASKTLPKQ